MENKLTIKLDMTQLNTVFSALGKLPYENVCDIIENIRMQVLPQVNSDNVVRTIHPTGE